MRRIEGGSGAASKTEEQQSQEDFSASAVQALISAAKNEQYDAARYRSEPPRHAMSAQRFELVCAVFKEYEVRTMTLIRPLPP